MDNAPVKKKKYVKMKSPTEASEKDKTQKESTKQQGSTLARGRFDYTFDQIINHIFAKLLPDNRFTIRLSEKLIFGKEKQIDQLIGNLDENIKYFSGFVIELNEEVEREDIEFEIEECYKAKLFGLKLIEKCIIEFFEGTKYELECTSFLKMFRDQQYVRLYVRISRQYEEQFIAKIQEKAHPIREANVSDKITRGNRKNLRNEVTNIVIDGKQFDSKHLKDFLHKSQKLDKKDIEIIENKNSFGYTETYTVKLACYEEESERKLQAFNYYFRHQNFIKLPLKETKHKTDLIQKYEGFNYNWLTIKLIKGYKSTKWDDKTLIYKIRCNSVSNKKTNFTNEFFQAFHLIGLLPKVREYLEELEYEINNVPLDDVKEELFLEIQEEIKDALKSSSKVEDFIQGYIKDYSQKFLNVCDVIAIKFPVRGIKLNILIKPGKDEEFKKQVKYDLQVMMMKEIVIRKSDSDFAVDEEFLEKLQKQGIIVIGHEQKSFTYIGKNEKFSDSLQKIQQIKRELQSFSQEYIEVQGKTKLGKYLQLIKTIKDNQQYEQIYITEPESTDKINFKIGFIGPRKKNCRFTELVNQKLQEVQKTLGTYKELIDSEQVNFLIEDNYIQDQILKKHNISIVIDPSHLIEAQLIIEPLTSKKQVYISKSKNLNQVPYGSSIFFLGKNQLDKFQEKFLDILKMKAKRMVKNELVKEVQPNRKLNLFYKMQMNEIQLISNALDLDTSPSICFILPDGQKKRFIKQILTILTSNVRYEKATYRIIILDTDFLEDVRKLVDLPQFTTLKLQEQLIVEWFCEGKPYLKSGNNKINDALAKGLTSCVLASEDFSGENSIPVRSHICDIQKNTITSLQTHEQMKLIFENDAIKFTCLGHKFQLDKKTTDLIKSYSKSSMSRFYLTLSSYQVNLINFTQVNMFTGVKKNIEKRQKSIKLNIGQYDGKVHASYDLEIPQIIYSFDESDSKKLHDAIEQIHEYIQNHRITEVIRLKKIGAKYLPNIKELVKVKAEENYLTYNYNSYSNEVTIKSLIKNNIERFKRIVENEVEYLLSLEKMELNANSIQKSLSIQYPQIWEPQAEEIKIFPVSQLSKQYERVQQIFTLAPISYLFRIQNKFLYKKFIGELDHLTFLNKNKKPNVMQLFHGTATTDPQVIWGDKQEGFNINYSSQNNLLGRGIYFAQKSQYSYNYRFKQSQHNLCSMFLCDVIVGDSQEMLMTHNNNNIKDTNAKSNGLKYESMRGKHSICDIYVVYKDKRAYPQYLIKFKL